MKTFLVWSAGIASFIFLIVVIGFIYLYVRGSNNANAIETMCKFEVGTPIEVILQKARSLGFSENNQRLLGPEIEAFSLEQKIIKPIVDKEVSELNGKIVLRKMIFFPFLRHFCEIKFQDGYLISVRKIVLD